MFVRRCDASMKLNDAAHSSAMTIRGLSDVLAERPSRRPTAASYVFRMTIGWPSMLRYVRSPAFSGMSDKLSHARI